VCLDETARLVIPSGATGAGGGGAWRDNVLLSSMYLRLLAGFVIRLPVLIARRLGRRYTPGGGFLRRTRRGYMLNKNRIHTIAYTVGAAACAAGTCRDRCEAGSLGAYGAPRRFQPPYAGRDEDTSEAMKP